VRQPSVKLAAVKKGLAILFALLLLLPASGLAQTREKANAETGFRAVIDDGAGLLDSAEYDGVMEAMLPIAQYCNVGFYTYSGASKDYVADKAKAWAAGEFGASCTLFIIDMATRQLAVWSSSDIQKTLTQAKSYTITDNVYRYASRKQYAACAESAFNQMYQVLKGETVSGPMRYISNALLALLAAILLAYLFISARMEQEIKVSMPEVVTATVGAGAVIASKKLMKKVRHSSSSGGGFHGGGGGGFGGGGGGGFSGGGGSHGF